MQAAQRRLAEANAVLSQTQARLQDAVAEQGRRELSLQGARLTFAAARTVSGLRRAEELVRGVEQELATLAERVGRLRAACAQARAVLSHQTQQLAEAERGRRAVGQVLEVRREAADKRRERGDEEQAEDAHAHRDRGGRREGPLRPR